MFQKVEETTTYGSGKVSSLLCPKGLTKDGYVKIANSFGSKSKLKSKLRSKTNTSKRNL